MTGGWGVGLWPRGSRVDTGDVKRRVLEEASMLQHLKKRVFRAIFPVEYQVVEAAARIARLPNPVHYMEITTSRIPSNLISLMLSTDEARSELEAAVRGLPDTTLPKI